MRKRRYATDEDFVEEPLINLTPLIDVVFVVLITFMLIAPAIQLDHVELADGGPSHAKEPISPSAPHLVVHVKADNTIWFQGRSVSVKELEEGLKKGKKQHPNETPQVVQDRKAAFGAYQTVKNTLETCGFEQMDIVLSPAR
ncbi:MAG: biopolymer transporter ExbD [Chlamydiae bacterium]|nr:biopolymer transporter ExbD [Chlamydiota bacterium]